jgi:hypothetical protein
MSSSKGPFEIAEAKPSSSAISISSTEKRLVALGGGSEDISANDDLTPYLELGAIPDIRLLHREFDCPNYETCLSLSAALNWGSFTCKNCCGEVNGQLLWRARQILRKDRELSNLCQLPSVKISSNDDPKTQD